MTVKGFHTRQNLSVVAAVDEHLQGKKTSGNFVSFLMGNRGLFRSTITWNIKPVPKSQVIQSEHILAVT